MLYVFHGEDEFSRSEAIAQLRHRMDPVVGELNTALLDGRRLTLGELQAACNAAPFMGDRRLVIVRDLVSSAPGPKAPRRVPGDPTDGKAAPREPGEATAEDGVRGLAGYLPHLPESVRLVLDESRSLPAGHVLLRLAGECNAYVREFVLPDSAELEQWIAGRARGKRVGIAPDATALLATYVGPNLRLLDQELEKLATYLGGSGTIGRQDVETLVSSLQEASIFHMVDALGSCDGRRALVLLRRLLAAGEAPLYLLTMIARQFRLLIQARELDAAGVPPAEMARQMDVRPFVARKCLQQAMNFSPAELRTAMAQLLQIDVGIKTGRTDGPLALDLFVTRWARR